MCCSTPRTPARARGSRCASWPRPLCGASAPWPMSQESCRSTDARSAIDHVAFPADRIRQRRETGSTVMGSSTRTSGRRRASAPRRFLAAAVTTAAVTAATAALATTALLAGGAAAPAVAQSPSCPWMNTSLAPEQRAQMLVAAMNIDQKIAMLSQAQPIWTHYGVAGYVPGQPSLCIPDLVLNDAGQGVGDHEVHTVALPAPISQASSWDGSLQRRFGAALGWEAWHTGMTGELAPGTG